MAEIVITAPDSAKEGDVVSASVTVTSTLGYHASYKGDIKAVPDLYPDYVIGSVDQIILAGDSVTVEVSFTMPDCNTTIFLWLERWSFDEWVYDSSASEVVSLEAVPPPPRPPACSISIDAPASAEEGDTVGVTATITNNSEDAQRYNIKMYAGADLIAEWDDVISGDSADDYAESFTMPASDITILVWVELWWEGEWGYDNSASKVVSLEVPEYRGTIITKELEYDESRGSIPVY